MTAGRATTRTRSRSRGRTGTRAGRAAASAAGQQEVSVRMYTQGLGDCFLISFDRPEGDPYHMVIDCGVFKSTSGAKEKMQDVVRSIDEATKGHINLLVVTHKHWDHLSSFVQAFDEWEDIQIDEIWLSWVENPRDNVGLRLSMNIDSQLSNLRRALAEFPAALSVQADKVRNILDFFEDDPGEDGSGDLGLLGAGAPSTKAEAMQYLREHENANVTYHEPGEDPFTPPDLPGVRIYVLGPPRNEALLGKEDPSTVNSEVYQLAPTLRLADSFAAALLPADSAGSDLRAKASQCFPFDEMYRIDAEKVAAGKTEFAPFFNICYGNSEKDAWRRIDNDWLNVADQLALNLDNVVNNCSLVLAIELQQSKKVLLFVADAQVGNWLSWEDVEFKVKEGEATRTVTGPDLLARTVFYKVGHHGSHNATLREKGLERMASSGDLVAMIPVDHDVVAQKGWEMPFDKTLDRLKEKTEGRVIVAFQGIPDESEVAERRRAAFKRDATAGENFVEYKLRG